VAGVKKLISVSAKIGHRILADQMRILIEYVKMDMVKDKLNEYTYITFIASTTILDVIHTMNIIVYISILSPYPLSFGFYSNGLHDLWC